MKSFQETEFVIVDVETTGFSARGGDRIIEIAALKVKGPEIVDEFHSLINPSRSISLGAFLVNGITEKMLKGAPTADQILPDFVDFIEKACWVGHNIRFDLNFLKQELIRMGRDLEHKKSVLDTVRMARGLIPELGRYSLLSVAQFLDVGDRQQHRAMADVELTLGVFRKLLEFADRRDICEIEQLTRLYGWKDSP